ncbi:MAG: hypothetical protein JWO63_616 [Frankiales bacterium]|nr:hypothetical protein [Frankiales bacterium]
MNAIRRLPHAPVHAPIAPTSPIAPALDPVQLVEFTRFIAAEVAAGYYPYVEYSEAERWHQRIYRDQRVDVWLISWLPSQGTQLHDHGGSGGAFTVLSGELSEAVYRPAPARRRRPDEAAEALLEQSRPAGSAVGFGAHYVHDVRNLGERPAVSVHAYSPPLTSMNYYDVTDVGELRRIVTLATEDPEPDAQLGLVSRSPAA